MRKWQVGRDNLLENSEGRHLWVTGIVVPASDKKSILFAEFFTRKVKLLNCRTLQLQTVYANEENGQYWVVSNLFEIDDKILLVSEMNFGLTLY